MAPSVSHRKDNKGGPCATVEILLHLSDSMRIVKSGGRGGMESNMPTLHFEPAVQPVDVGIEIDGDTVVVELPHELIGAYLLG